eukprot:GFYU01025653.1.p1 GENE.GFYU01025653.1~~GFYU01025653.1.p1  ORF type:complete len:237 (-),score=68.41 GFYU01025653.1:301-1011(-)
MAGVVKVADFDKRDYWEERYSKNNAASKKFEWYTVEYVHMKPFIETLNLHSKTILEIGCGNSNIALDMAIDGYQKVIAVDYVSSVIEGQKDKLKAYNEKQTDTDGVVGVSFQVADVTNMKEYGDASFDAVVDKATMDALVTCEGDMARQTFTEVDRVLCVGGYFLLVSCSGIRLASLMGPGDSSEDMQWDAASVLKGKVGECVDGPDQRWQLAALHGFEKEKSPDIQWLYILKKVR